MRIEDRSALAERFRKRYLAAKKAQRSELLVVFCEVTGYSRKHAICVLRGRQRSPGDGHGRPSRYRDLEFKEALAVLWQATYCVCAERFSPALPDLADLLVLHGQLEIGESVRCLLEQASVSTVERQFRVLRVELNVSRRLWGRGAPAIRREIPVVVGEWKDLDRPGFCEVDLVSHMGSVAYGDSAYTLTLTDICTAWTELLPVLGKGQTGIVLPWTYDGPSVRPGSVSKPSAGVGQWSRTADRGDEQGGGAGGPGI